MIQSQAKSMAGQSRMNGYMYMCFLQKGGDF